jgi:hypothetical protein
MTATARIRIAVTVSRCGVLAWGAVVATSRDAGTLLGMHARKTLLAIAACTVTAAAALAVWSAGDTGTAPIAPTGLAAAATLAGCPEAQDPQQCLDAAAEQIYREQGAAALPTTIDTWIAAAAPEFYPCHRVLHSIGKAAATDGLTTQDIADAGAVASTCANGFMHGLVEGIGFEAAQQGASSATLSTDLQRLCREVGPTLRNDCYHSSGHAASIASPGNVRTALAVCDRIAPAESGEATRCSAGVFMSYGRGLAGFDETGTQRWITMTDEEMSTICQEQTGGRVDVCWFYLWMVYGFDEGRGSPAAYAALCPGNGAPGFDQCHRGVGMLLLGRDDTSNPAVAARQCPQTDPDAVAWCAFGTAWGDAYDYRLAFGSLDGHRSRCTEYPAALVEMCRRAEAEALEDGDGL